MLYTCAKTSHCPFSHPSGLLYLSLSLPVSILPLIVSACWPEDSHGTQLIHTCRIPLPHTLISCMLGFIEEMLVGCWHSMQPHKPRSHSVIIALSDTHKNIVYVLWRVVIKIIICWNIQSKLNKYFTSFLKAFDGTNCAALLFTVFNMCCVLYSK